MVEDTEDLALHGLRLIGAMKRFYFVGPQGRAVLRFIYSWEENTVH